MTEKRKILIAGASGFVGRALIEHLLSTTAHELVGLSRRPRTSATSRLSWKECDLFSLKDISLAMEGVDTAYYLVHSMLPSATLSQGTFYDFDLIMADNFVRAARERGVKHIIYLGGMIPVADELSWHLKSRLEVEETLKHSTIRTTVLRAGLIIGPNGSSFTILQKLIERLPLMICPTWTKTRSQPAAIGDVVKVLARVISDERLQGTVYDIGGPEVITYQGLIQKAAAIIKKRPTIFTLNVIPLGLSRLWVRLVTGVPKDLVYPLVLSLRHEMLVTPSHRWPHAEDLSTSIDEALNRALDEVRPVSFEGHRPVARDVRSIQRLILPPGKDAAWVAVEYFNWLPSFFSTLIRAAVDGNYCTFYLFNPNIKLLVLEKSVERSRPDRQLLYIVGGLLAAVQKRGRLEFREVLDRRYVMAAIHEFRPRLPWFVYRWTQAIIHLMVMRAFGEHLKWHYLSQKRITV